MVLDTPHFSSSLAFVDWLSLLGERFEAFEAVLGRNRLSVAGLFELECTDEVHIDAVTYRLLGGAYAYRAFLRANYIRYLFGFLKSRCVVALHVVDEPDV